MCSSKLIRGYLWELNYETNKIWSIVCTSRIANMSVTNISRADLAALLCEHLASCAAWAFELWTNCCFSLTFCGLQSFCFVTALCYPSTKGHAGWAIKMTFLTPVQLLRCSPAETHPWKWIHDSLFTGLCSFRCVCCVPEKSVHSVSVVREIWRQLWEMGAAIGLNESEFVICCTYEIYSVVCQKMTSSSEI